MRDKNRKDWKSIKGQRHSCSPRQYLLVLYFSLSHILNTLRILKAMKRRNKSSSSKLAAILLVILSRVASLMIHTVSEAVSMAREVFDAIKGVAGAAQPRPFHVVNTEVAHLLCVARISLGNPPPPAVLHGGGGDKLHGAPVAGLGYEASAGLPVPIFGAGRTAAHCLRQERVQADDRPCHVGDRRGDCNVGR